MDNKASIIMREEIRKLSKYRALRLSIYFMDLSLIFYFIIFRFHGYDMSPLYILLLLNVLPLFIEHTLKETAKKSSSVFWVMLKEVPFQLSFTKDKYNYSKIKHLSNSIIFIIAQILLLIWQFRLNTFYYSSTLLSNAPIFILMFSFLIRFLGSIIYTFKLHYDISYNR